MGRIFMMRILQKMNKGNKEKIVKFTSFSEIKRENPFAINSQTFIKLKY